MTDAEVISRLQSSTKMQNKADFVKSALQQTGMAGTALEFVNPKFQKDPQMAKLAVENNAMTLQFVSVQCKGLDQIALTAVKKNGLALQFVPPEICKEHILLAAVKQNGQALKYAVCPCGIAERGHRAGCCGEKTPRPLNLCPITSEPNPLRCQSWWKVYQQAWEMMMRSVLLQCKPMHDKLVPFWAMRMFAAS